MKIPVSLWALVMLLTLFTAGFFPMLIIGALSAASAISTGFHVQNQHAVGGRSYKALK